MPTWHAEFDPGDAPSRCRTCRTAGCQTPGEAAGGSGDDRAARRAVMGAQVCFEVGATVRRRSRTVTRSGGATGEGPELVGVDSNIAHGQIDRREHLGGDQAELVVHRRQYRCPTGTGVPRPWPSLTVCPSDGSGRFARHGEVPGSVFALGFGVAGLAVEVLEEFDVAPRVAGFDAGEKVADGV